MRVLVVDDEPAVRRATKNAFLYLSPVECEVQTASNGQEAVAHAAAGGFDLIIMDIRMPVMDGYEAVKKICAAGSSAVIVFFTAYSQDETRELALAAGGHDYLVKPVTNWRSQIARLVTLVGEHNAT